MTRFSTTIGILAILLTLIGCGGGGGGGGTTVAAPPEAAKVARMRLYIPPIKPNTAPARTPRSARP